MPPPPNATMHCRVIAVEPLGGEAIVDLTLDGKLIKAMVDPDVRVEPDELLPVEFDLARIHLFARRPIGLRGRRLGRLRAGGLTVPPGRARRRT